MKQDENLIRGRGAQLNPHNIYHKGESTHENYEVLDVEPEYANPQTKYYVGRPKTIVNKVKSPDVGMMYSMNPYQGCEHGCIYCYARNSHQYWGFSGGLEFESKIIVKHNAPELLETYFKKRGYQPETIMLSGNTDCYQPIERKMRLTRRCLELFLEYRHPVSILTKNYTILRDLDILKELASHNLVHTMLSVTTLDAELQQKMEPRTAPPRKRLKAIEELHKNNIPVRLMLGPTIPGLNDREIPAIIKSAAEAGAQGMTYTIIHLNGIIAEVFTDWIEKAYPLKADKVLNKIREIHGGQLNDSRWGTRKRGEGNIAQMMHELIRISRDRYLGGRHIPPLDHTKFRVFRNGQLGLFA